MVRYKTLIAFLILIILSGCRVLSAPDMADDDTRVSVFNEHKIPIESTDTIAIRTPSGNVRVINDPFTTQLKVQIGLGCGGYSKADAEERLQSSYVRVSRRGMTVSFDAVFSGGYRDGDVASFTIRTPKLKACSIYTSGTVDIRGFQGNLGISIERGSVNLHQCHGTLNLTSNEADISLFEHVGHARVDTLDGDIEATGCTGPLNLTTDDGDIVVKRAPPSHMVFARSASGSVYIDD